MLAIVFDHLTHVLCRYVEMTYQLSTTAGFGPEYEMIVSNRDMARLLRSKTFTPSD